VRGDDRPPAGAGPRLADLAAPPGLCADCVHRRLVATRRSTFLRCALADADPRFSRYPPLPVVRCAGWVRETREG
jgi:hypothetical protein